MKGKNFGLSRCMLYLQRELNEKSFDNLSYLQIACFADAVNDFDKKCEEIGFTKYMPFPEKGIDYLRNTDMDEDQRAGFQHFKEHVGFPWLDMGKKKLEPPKMDPCETEDEEIEEEEEEEEEEEPPIIGAQPDYFGPCPKTPKRLKRKVEGKGVLRPKKIKFYPIADMVKRE